MGLVHFKPKKNAHFICNSKNHSNGDILISIEKSIIKNSQSSRFIDKIKCELLY
jgi:hypothetical protein